MPRKPGPQLTLEEIIEAAAGVLERDGYDRLTMRALAAALNVQAPALYWHVKDKRELSLLLFDRLIADLDYGRETGEWREDIRRMMTALRRRLVETRDITRLFPDDYSQGPRAIRPMEQAMGILRRAGFDPADALQAYGVALSFVVGWARFEVTRRGSAPSAERFSPPPEIFPNLAWAMGGGMPDLEAGFDFGIGLLLDGLERRRS